MTHRQDEEQAARKQAEQGAGHEAKPKDWPGADQWPSYTPQAETDNEFPEDSAAGQPPSFTPQGRTDNEPEEETDAGARQPSQERTESAPPGTVPANPGRSGGTGQGRTDQGGEGRMPK